MQVKLISMTKPVAEELTNFVPEDIISYCARVSNPSNQMNTETTDRLLKYCAKHGHWSVFEMVDATFEIKTSRAIAAQILRHKSLQFQEFSQRYSNATDFEIVEARRQDLKNKQNSINDMSDDDRIWFNNIQSDIIKACNDAYNQALSRGIAKEQARFLLPLSTQTTLYAKGSIRSWIHYIAVRGDASTQKEHREIALEIKKLLAKEFPSVALACNWNS